jgi:hypothetical protein
MRLDDLAADRKAQPASSRRMFCRDAVFEHATDQSCGNADSCVGNLKVRCSQGRRSHVFGARANQNETSGWHGFRCVDQHVHEDSMQGVSIARDWRQPLEAAECHPDLMLAKQDVEFSDGSVYRGVEVDVTDAHRQLRLRQAAVDEPRHAADLGLDRRQSPAGGGAETLDTQQLRVSTYRAEWRTQVMSDSSEIHDAPFRASGRPGTSYGSTGLGATGRTDSSP